MYAVGADRLEDYWREHPEAEAELRALHALLTETEPAALRERLGAIASFDETGADIALATARVRVRISEAAGVALYVGVAPAEEEG